ncbi:hypothetical protein KKD19_00215 [Patescibacteria group bacterium]|nr:hypothetical protein [Patescibacteria group bacterium]MBU4511657.1 hypothetical protein [Patescibacteria group bacterium]MCG2693295.1 hypothetical protein [Candidatus Parcubacteria bacterium]
MGLPEEMRVGDAVPPGFLFVDEDYEPFFPDDILDEPGEYKVYAIPLELLAILPEEEVLDALYDMIIGGGEDLELEVPLGLAYFDIDEYKLSLPGELLQDISEGIFKQINIPLSLEQLIAESPGVAEFLKSIAEGGGDYEYIVVEEAEEVGE